MIPSYWEGSAWARKIIVMFKRKWSSDDVYQNDDDRMHENLALEQPVEELDNLEKHARNLVKARWVRFWFLKSVGKIIPKSTQKHDDDIDDIWWRLMTFEPIVSGWRPTQIEWWWSRKTPPSQRTRWKGDSRTHQIFLFQIDIINLYWRYSIFYNIFVCFGRIFPNVLQCFVCVCGEFDIINWYWRRSIFWNIVVCISGEFYIIIWYLRYSIFYNILVCLGRMLRRTWERTALPHCRISIRTWSIYQFFISIIIFIYMYIYYIHILYIHLVNISFSYISPTTIYLSYLSYIYLDLVNISIFYPYPPPYFRFFGYREIRCPKS